MSGSAIETPWTLFFKPEGAPVHSINVSEESSQINIGVEIDTASLTYDPEEWRRKILEGMPPMSEEMKALLEKHCEAAKQKEAQE